MKSREPLDKIMNQNSNLPTRLPPSVRCSQCHDAGWVLDCSNFDGPRALEVIACPLPDCDASGKVVEIISVNDIAGLAVVTRNGLTNQIMSLSQLKFKGDRIEQKT